MFQIDKKGFSEKEEQVLAFWEKEKVFERSLEQRKKATPFTFYDGPPFATGLPHYGHLLAGTIKDAIPRFMTMKGFFVPRRFGWDCHGLPVENEIEKSHALSGAPEIEAFGIAKFNAACRSIVLRYTEEWKTSVRRMGRWVDIDNAYRTMDRPYMESVWWVFSELWKKGLVYKGFKVMPVSAKLGTPLSNFEANLNYKEIDDPSLYVKAPLVDDGRILIAWTTTPWTLPANLAIAVHPDLMYAEVLFEDKRYIVASARVQALFKGKGEIVKEFPGKALAGKRYEPFFPYYTKHSKAFHILADPFVGADEGTGIVHTAPAFGEIDYYLCKNAGIELVCPVDHNGKFTREIPELAGLWVKDADKVVVKKLKEAGKVFRIETVHHRYPFCWRSDTPLIYKAVETWFIAVEPLKDRLLANNEKIHWVPDHIKHGRFGKWLENARDWAVSRNRYWGTPIPIWESEAGDLLIIGSVDELEVLAHRQVPDLHRHCIDAIDIVKEGKRYRRINEVFDCWFESGAMPYAQNHYPFENATAFQNQFPADFIAEGLDQTRGWFYTLTVLSTALFDKPAFKNVIVNGILLAEDGSKMSKRLKNYPDPADVIKDYGADSIRLYMLASPAALADDLAFSKRGVELTLRQILIPLWNAYVFHATYATLYRWTPTFLAPTIEIDRWILSRLQTLIHTVDTAMGRFALADAISPLATFIDELTNWYIRRCRPRFWADDDTHDRQTAFSTLHHVLFTLVKIAAPFIPFLTETLYQELRSSTDPLSVHLADFPTCNTALQDLALEEAMGAVKQVVSLGHALRKAHKLKVRQPLRQARLIMSVPSLRDTLAPHCALIEEELNVKQLILSIEDTTSVILQAKPLFPVLGKRFGKQMPAIAAAIRALKQETLVALEKKGSVDILIDGHQETLFSYEVIIEMIAQAGGVAMTEGPFTLFLDTHLDKALLTEGLAREIINKINTMRRDQNFDVTDRITVTIDSTPAVQAAYKEFQPLIHHETLAEEITFAPCPHGESWDLNGENARIQIVKGALPL